MRMHRLAGLLAGGVLSLGVALAPASVAAAATTEVFHGSVVFGPSHIFCTEEAGFATGEVTEIYHVTTHPDGTFLAVFHGNGTATFTPDDPSHPAWTGRYTINDVTYTGDSLLREQWIYINHGADHMFTFHEVYHLSVTSGGAVLEFDHATLTCN